MLTIGAKCSAVNETVYKYLESIKKDGEKIAPPKYEINMNE